MVTGRRAEGDGSGGAQHAWCFLTQPHLQIDRVTG
jgi:hypothetical protein